MRFISICAMLLAFVLALVCQSYARIDTGTVVGLWLFNEGKGEVAKDSSGNGNDGKFGGGGAKWVNAKYGKGLEFDGTGWLECGKGESLDFKDSTNFSIHSIVKAEVTTGKCVIWKGLGCSTWSQWLLGTGAHENGDNATMPEFHIRLANGAARKFARADDPLPENEWVQVAGTYDGKQLKVYVNGELAKAADVEGNPWASPEQVYIGADPGCGNRCQWVGVIDEIAVFNVTLNDDDIKTLSKGYENASAVSPTGKLATAWGNLKAD
ncbi:MAG: LamG domain-containing protein [Candidatus Poribacteria bacterium]